MTKLTNCLNAEEACKSSSPEPPEQRLESHSHPHQVSLQEAIQHHLSRELVSFHTPGHKGRAFNSQPTDTLSMPSLKHDLTELPGLDDLANPTTVIKQLELSIATLWKTRASLISLNGASAGMVASILSVASRATKLLVPRNAHKSVVDALVLSGLEPLWYEPEWNKTWQIFGSVEPEQIRCALKKHGGELAAVIVVSPTYPGALSQVESIAALCHEHNVPLIVDEAHGAHMLPESNMPASAIQQGADLVVHSLHKTLGAMTQTGLIHITNHSLVSESAVRQSLKMMQSTSPSYPLLLSVERAVSDLTDKAGMHNLQQLQDRAARLRRDIDALQSYDVYEVSSAVDPLHILLAHRERSANELNSFLVESGIFAESTFGRGLLLMLGVGTNESDMAQLMKALEQFAENHRTYKPLTPPAEETPVIDPSQLEIAQAMSPRAASLAPSQVVPIADALNKIASECIAACPPGIPLCVPGQKLSKDVLKQIEKIEKDQIRIVS